jgi:hypothetical protein
MSSKSKHLSVRLPNKEAAVIERHAASQNCSRSEAILHYIQLGIKAEANEQPVTKSDLALMQQAVIQAIQAQPIAVADRLLPEAEDWKSKTLLERVFRK